MSETASSEEDCGISAESSRKLTVPALDAFRELGFDTVKSVSGCAIEHHNTGTRWRTYRMYAYAHPIEDALENISHSIFTPSAGDQYPTGTPIVQVQRHVG